MTEEIRVLIVEDSEDNALLIVHELRKSGYNPKYERVDTKSGMEMALKHEEWDIVLCNSKVPDFRADEALGFFKEIDLEIPFILISGTLKDELVVEMMSSGAQDYIMKGKMTKLVPAIEWELRDAKACRYQRNVEQALHESEMRYRTLIQSMHDLVFVFDENDCYSEYYAANSHLLYVPAEEFMGQKITEVLPPEISKEYLKGIQRVRSTGKSETFNYPLEIEDKMYWFSSSLSRHEDGVSVVSVVRDITERKSIDERVQLLSSAVAQSTEGIAITNLEGNLLFTNKAFAAMHGYSPEELIGRHLSIFHTSEQMPSVIAANKQIQETGEFSGEIWHVRRDGSTFPTLMRNSLLRDDSGNPIGMIGTLRDITTRKQAEKALQESEEKYRTVIENIPAIAWITDDKGNTVFISPNIKQIYGYTPEDIYEAGESLWFGRIHPDDVERVRNEYSMSFVEGKGFDTEYRIKRKDGEWIWLHDISTGTFVQDGIRYASGLFRDVTERKKIEMAFREQYNLLTTIFGTTPNPFVLKDTNCVYVAVNKAFCEFVGKNEEEIIGKTDYDLFPEEEAEKYIADDNLVMSGGQQQKEEWQVTGASGPTWLKVVKSPVIDKKTKECTGILCSITDISKIKQAEAALRESEERFSQFMNNLPGAVYIKDKDFRTLYVNQYMIDVLGAKDWIGKTAIENLPAKIGKQMLADDMKALKEKVEILEQVPDRNGKNHFYHTIKFPILRKGKTPLLGGVSLDITKRIEAEKALQESEKKYQMLFDTAPVAIVITDYEGNFVAANKWMEKVSQYSKEELQKVNARDLYWNPDDRERALVILQEKRSLSDFEVQLKRKDGSPFHALLNEDMIDFSGQIANFATIRDITKRKKAEDDMKSAAEAAMLYLDLMGHDIRNYLQAIMIGTDILQHRELEPEIKSVCDTIVQSVLNSQDLIEKVQATRGLLLIPLSNVPLKEAIDDSLKLLKKTYDNIKIKVVYDVKEPIVMADRYIKHLLMNILENAVIHNEKETKRIWVALSEKTDGYEVSISDNGCGIPDGEKGILFDPNRRFGGVGIHQAVKIIQKYGGSIRVYDRVSGNPNQGVEFRIWFPKQAGTL